MGGTGTGFGIDGADGQRYGEQNPRTQHSAGGEGTVSVGGGGVIGSGVVSGGGVIGKAMIPGMANMRPRTDWATSGVVRVRSSHGLKPMKEMPDDTVGKPVTTK